MTTQHQVNDSLEGRLNLIASYWALADVLGRLAHEGSSYALSAWDRLPALPPVWNVTQLAIALHVARESGPLTALAYGEAAPEWTAYRSALWAFSQAPLYGPPPMRCLAQPVAACPMNPGGYVLCYDSRPTGR